MKKIKFEDLPSENTPIISANLNGMQDNIEESAVIVSATEPITKEKVWFQKGKNLFDGIIEEGTYNIDTGKKEYNTQENRSANYIAVEPNTNYIFSNNSQAIGMNVCMYNKNKTYIKTIQAIKQSFITLSNCYFITWHKFKADTDKVQLEQGSVATPYEPYTPKKILTKTNGVFEEFLVVPKEEQWELIEEVKGQGAGVSRTNEPDGTPYNFKELFAEFNIGGTTANCYGNVTCYTQDGSNVTLRLEKEPIPNSVFSGVFSRQNKCLRPKLILPAKKVGDTFPLTSQVNENPHLVFDDSPIIRLNTTLYLPAGATLKIYAVRF